MTASQDAGELLDGVCRVLIDHESAAFEAVRRAGEACDAAERARNAADTDKARAEAGGQVREADREWNRVMGQVDAFRQLVSEVVEVGVHPYSRAERAQHAQRPTGSDPTALRQRDDTHGRDHGGGHHCASRGRSL